MYDSIMTKVITCKSRMSDMFPPKLPIILAVTARLPSYVSAIILKSSAGSVPPLPQPYARIRSTEVVHRMHVNGTTAHAAADHPSLIRVYVCNESNTHCLVTKGPIDNRRVVSIAHYEVVHLLCTESKRYHHHRWFMNYFILLPPFYKRITLLYL